MKKPMFVCFIVAASLAVFAQKSSTAKDYKAAKFDLGKLNCLSAVTLSDTLLTVKLKLVNKSDAFYLFKTGECAILLGDDRVRTEPLEYSILPSDSEEVTLNFASALFKKQPALTFIAEGFYEVPANGDVQTPPIFNLPPDLKDFVQGTFTGLMTKDSRTTELTEIEFKVTYTGEKVGIVNPAKTLLRLTDGLLVNNMLEKSKPFLLTKGYNHPLQLRWPKTPEMLTDMAGNHLELLWRETFVESMANRITPEKILLEPVVVTPK